MKNELYVGQKLYHYAFGPMTITRFDDVYVDTTIDDVQGILMTNVPVEGGPCVKWFVASIGHWVFTDPDMVGDINNDFKAPNTFYDMDKMRIAQQSENVGNWHKYYGKKKSNKSRASSPVGITGTTVDDSPVGVRGKSDNNESSPVGIVQKK